MRTRVKRLVGKYIQYVFPVAALVLALAGACGVHDLERQLRAERTRTDHLVRLLHQRIWYIENWHGWPPVWGRLSEAVRDHEHTRETSPE